MAGSGIITTGSTPRLLSGGNKPSKSGASAPKNSKPMDMNCGQCGAKLNTSTVVDHMKSCGKNKL